MGHRRLGPRLRDRLAAAVPGPGWRRLVWLRRLTAGALTGLALVLALAPPDRAARVPVLVAAADLAPGTPVRAGDLEVQRWPADLTPAGALSERGAAEGRMLIGAVRAGEALTDVRLAGAATRGSAPGTAAVPVRLTDAGVAGFLGPGSRIDVVGVGGPDGAAVVLAADATVLAVLPAEDGPAGGSHERLILVAMARELATRVAAAAVADQLAITLR